MGASERFVVDPDALSGARAEVGRLLRDMGEFVEVTVPPPDVFGHDELAESAAEFQERWKDGVDQLVGDTEGIHRRLLDTLDEYRRADRDLAALFREVRGGEG